MVIKPWEKFQLSFGNDMAEFDYHWTNFCRDIRSHVHCNSTEKFLAFHTWLSWFFLAFSMCKKVWKARNDIPRRHGILHLETLEIQEVIFQAFLAFLAFLAFPVCKKVGKPGMIPGFPGFRSFQESRNAS